MITSQDRSDFKITYFGVYFSIILDKITVYLYIDWGNISERGL